MVGEGLLERRRGRTSPRRGGGQRARVAGSEQQQPGRRPTGHRGRTRRGVGWERSCSRVWRRGSRKVLSIGDWPWHWPWAPPARPIALCHHHDSNINNINPAVINHPAPALPSPAAAQYALLFSVLAALACCIRSLAGLLTLHFSRLASPFNACILLLLRTVTGQYALFVSPAIS
jgi:hypothetical protein